MSVYFIFSDECGDYTQHPSRKFLERHPYYIRTNIIIKGQDWKLIYRKYIDLLNEFGLPLESEIKWSYLWSLRWFQQREREIPPDKPFYFLRNITHERIETFVTSFIDVISDLSYIEIIYTITSNGWSPQITENNLFKFHIQEMLQRIEMELQGDNSNIGIVFYDFLSTERKNKYFRDTYHTMFKNGDFIQTYKHIMDSLNIDYSHQSVGLILVDYIGGVLNGLLKGFPNSINIYNRVIKNHIRNSSGETWGYGLREVPRNPFLRKNLSEKIPN